MMSIEARECENCGASVVKKDLRCNYCGTWVEGNKGETSDSKPPTIISSILNLPQGMEDFGLSSNLFLVIGTTILAVLYALGWSFEDKQYWLDDTALLMWVGIMPITMFGIALLWRVTGTVMLYGLGFSLLVFLVHILIIWVIQGYLWDDHYGIATLVACAAWVGWSLGRLGHRIIRWSNSRVQ